MMRILGWALATMMMAGSGVAEPINGDAAKKMLFSARGANLQVLEDSGLDATQNAIVGAILKQMKTEGVSNYYGAIAVSPSFFSKMAEDPGQAALSGLLQISERLHSPAAAEGVALTACKKARASGDAPCVLAARILPRNYKAHPVSLSVSATQAFKEYRKGKGGKALAVSAATVAYAIAKGDGAAEAALAACNKGASKTSSPDCEVVIAD